MERISPTAGEPARSQEPLERLLHLLRRAAERIRQLEAEKDALRQGSGRPSMPEAVQRLVRLMYEDASTIERLGSDKQALAEKLAAAELENRDLRFRLSAAERGAGDAEARALRAVQRAVAAEARAEQAELRTRQVEGVDEWVRLLDCEAARSIRPRLAA